jgi:hypothetical protein
VQNKKMYLKNIKNRNDLHLVSDSNWKRREFSHYF